MANNRIAVNLLVADGFDLYHGSSILSGLAALRARGVITLEISQDSTSNPDCSHIVRMHLRNPELGDRRVAIDLFDQAFLRAAVLEEADVYFKRSFQRQVVATLPTRYRDRVVPFGLNFASLSLAAIPLHLRISSTLFGLRSRGSHGENITRIRAFLDSCALAGRIPAASAFEATLAEINAKRNGKVLLQTRIWAPEPSADNLEALNTDRIALVRTLRQGLGSHFAGGIIGDEFSRRACPAELLVYQATHRRVYARALRAAEIGVYVRGLHHSLGFKMAEYLAAGLCIVCEPLKHELPVPLQEGVNYLTFGSPDDCVTQCRWLLSHPAEAARMSCANLDYYRKWVAPSAHMLDILDRCFETSESLDARAPVMR